MTARVAGFGLERRMVVVGRPVVVLLGYRGRLVIVRRRPVMMLRVIVLRVLVHVPRGGQGRRPDQQRGKQECRKTAHTVSLLLADEGHAGVQPCAFWNSLVTTLAWHSGRVTFCYGGERP